MKRRKDFASSLRIEAYTLIQIVSFQISDIISLMKLVVTQRLIDVWVFVVGVLEQASAVFDISYFNDGMRKSNLSRI